MEKVRATLILHLYSGLSARSLTFFSACQLCMAADYQALGLGNEFGDFEGEIQAKYAGLKDGSKTVDDVVSELDAVIAAN